MSDFPERLKLKEQADEDLYFAREERAWIAGHRPLAQTLPQADELRIVSGGQTGVDRAALDAAMALGIAHGGWCPLGRRAEDGVIPARYALRESPSADYAERTEWNVRDSDATLVVYRHALSGGTLLTTELARRHGRALLTRDLAEPCTPGEVAEWLCVNRIRVLDCAGPRESGAPGIQVQASIFFATVFAAWQDELAARHAS